MSSTTSPAPRSRARTAIGAIAWGLAVGVTFALALVVAVLVQLNLPAARRILASQLTSLLADAVLGRATLEHVGRVGLGGVSGVRLRVLDPDGRQTLLADGVSLNVSFPDAARSALFGKGDIAIEVRAVDVDYAEVSIDAAPDGTLRIERALSPRHPAVPSGAGGRGLILDVAHARLGRAWVHGQAKDAPFVDAELEALEARATVAPDRSVLDLDGGHVRTRAAPRGANLEGDLQAHLAAPSSTGAELGAEGSFAGAAGGIPLHIRASLDGEHLDVVAEVRRARAADVRALAPEVPLRTDLAAHAEAHGTLADLAIWASAEVDPGSSREGSLALSATVELGAEKRARASLQARRIDARAFSPSAPESDIAANVEASVVVSADGDVRGRFGLDVLPGGQAAGEPLPRAAIRGNFTDRGARGEGDIAEPGAPTHLSFDVRALPEGALVEVDATTRVARLEAVRKLGPGRGRAEIRTTARLDTRSEQVEARARSDIWDASFGPHRVGHGTVDVRIDGTLSAPVVDASLRAEDIVAGGIGVSTAVASASGPLKAPTVTATLDGVDGSRLDARAEVEAGPGLTIRDARLCLARGGETAVAVVESVRVQGPTIVVVGVNLDGLGSPLRADVRVTPTELAVRAEAKGVDLQRLARLARVEEHLRAGRLALDVDLVVRGDHATGHCVVDLDGGSFEGLQGDAHLDARLMDRRMFGNLAAQARGIGSVYVNTSTLELGGPVLDPASWRQARGKVQLEADLDVAQLAKRLPADSLPAADLAGSLSVQGEIGREDPTGAPDIELSVATKGLSIAAKPESVSRVDGTKVLRPPAWRSTAMDLWLHATADGRSGRSRLEARATDGRGVVVGVDAQAELPYTDLVAEPARALRRLESVPFDVRSWVPRRALAKLPPVFRTTGFQGTAEASLQASGTALEPRVALVVRTGGVGGTGSPTATPTATDLNATYDGTTAVARVSMRTREGPVLDATSRAHVRAKDLFDPPPGELPWDASAVARFDRFPLHSVARIADMRVRGHISGELGLADLHEDARAQAKLRIDDLRVGRARYTGGFVDASLDGRGLDAKARLEQEHGFAETRAKMGMVWGKRLAPARDDRSGAEISVKADGFRAAALLPFVEETFSELDGNIDAEARVELAPGERRPVMSGKATLTGGVFEIPAIGEEFRDTTATVTLSNAGVIRAEHVSARGVTGEVLASAVARLDGLDLAAFRAAVRIPQNRPIPLALEGQALGEVSGDFKVDAKVARDKKSVDVVVDIPELRARIPDVDTRELQPLDPDETIRVGVRRTPGQLTLVPLGPPLEPRPGDATLYNVQIRLGSNVEVRRGTMVRAQIEGSPTITLDEETRMTGQLRLRGGALDVQGKRFEIEKGTITFAGEPDNPIVVVTATWTAPEGTRVFADYTGPLKTGKVTLRSEPSLPRNEILSLILFGTQGGNRPPAPGQEPSGASRAAGIGGGLATQGLNRALEDLTGLDVTARVDTSDTQNPRPELEFQIAKNVSLQIAYVLGVPPPGANPDKSLLTLDWRFFRNLSLETTVGDRGSSIVDLVWRKRY